MEVTMASLAALVGRTLDDPAVVSFFLTQPITAKRRKQGRTDLNGIRSLSSREQGYEVAHRKGRIETVFVYLREQDGYLAFQGVLEAGLTVSDTPKDVRRKLGSPTRSGAGDTAGRWPWDRYDSEALCLHIGYREFGDGLARITLMAPDVAP